MKKKDYIKFVMTTLDAWLDNKDHTVMEQTMTANNKKFLFELTIKEE